MNLDDAQKRQVASWIEEGLTLAAIQQKLVSDLGVQMTYMEVRLLMSELQLKPKDAPVPESAAGALAPKPSPAEAKADDKLSGGSPAMGEADEESGGIPGNMAIVVDKLTRPGSVVSGKVTFSDGNKAEWYLDQYGRLGLAAEKKGYKPSADDLMAFQAELQNALAAM